MTERNICLSDARNQQRDVKISPMKTIVDFSCNTLTSIQLLFSLILCIIFVGLFLAQYINFSLHQHRVKSCKVTVKKARKVDWNSDRVVVLRKEKVGERKSSSCLDFCQNFVFIGVLRPSRVQITYSRES